MTFHASNRAGQMRGLLLVIGLATLLSGLASGNAFAASPAPAWQITSAPLPSVLSPGQKEGRYQIAIENIGGAPTSGPITITDELPAGLSAKHLILEPGDAEEECSMTVSAVSCTLNESESVVPSGFIALVVQFNAAVPVGTGPLSSGPLRNRVTVSGGEAATASTSEPAMEVGAHEHETGPPGVAQFGFEATGPAGEMVKQAGAHPTFLTTRLLLNDVFDESVLESIKPVQAPKDLVFYLPLGMLGDPAVTDPCPASLVQLRGERSGCPVASRVGTVLPMVAQGIAAPTEDPTHEHGLYSMEPEHGYAAEFAFGSNGITFFEYASVVRHDGAYMLRVAVPGVPIFASLVGLVATFYGDISEPVVVGSKTIAYDRGAFITDPMNCLEPGEARQATFEMSTWVQPASWLKQSAPAFTELEGCGLLAFSSSMSVVPETTQAEAPSGYTLGLSFPQSPNSGSGLGTPPAKDVKIQLPAGTSISPSAANGLEACQETGPQGINIEGSESEAPGPDGLLQPVAGHCPAASRLANVQATTPLLREGNLSGQLFLAAPKCGGLGQSPCGPADAENGNLYSLFLELEDPNAGVIIKLAGKAEVNAETGQITAEFDENPQFPINKLTVEMKHGPQAPLANPRTCGAATAQATITSWAEPYTPESKSSDFFPVDWNGAGGACPATAPFAPTLTVGTTSEQAGSTSPFTLTLERKDREQNPLTLTTTLPEGLLAKVSKVAKCPEPQASAAPLTGCPAESLIGTVTAAVGSGADPYNVTGKVYFTGPYNGAPFGLSVVVPAVAGPFNLGNVIVRVALYVNPHTAQVTAVSGEIPQMLDGVPLRMRRLSVTLNAHEFVLNPTSCAPLSITGEVKAAEGANAAISAPFSATGCKDLPFKPSTSISTEARSTKPEGTGVTLKIALPGGDANVAKTVIGFPTKLPVRLETLRKACLAATFAANPAGCPSASRIGSVTVDTPILSQPLVGPAYLVSYGSSKFPNVVFVLQAEGVTLDVEGESFVSSSGALKVTVPAVPDAPFSTFEAVLPSGPTSQFTSAKSSTQAVSSQCGESMVAPVTMVGQNGAETSEDVKVQISGCGPEVSITKTKRTAKGLTVVVKTSERGSVRVSGVGIGTLAKKGVAAGKHTLQLHLTASGKQKARSHKKVKITVELVVGKQKARAHRKIAL